MTPEKQESNNAPPRAFQSPPYPPNGSIVEPNDSMYPVSHTTVPPGDYEEVMRRMKERMGEA